MSNLTEALAWWDGLKELGVRHIRELVAAARAYSEGEDIWWCEEHETHHLEGERLSTCLMVSRRVCPTVKEEK